MGTGPEASVAPSHYHYQYQHRYYQPVYVVKNGWRPNFVPRPDWPILLREDWERFHPIPIMGSYFSDLEVRPKNPALSLDFYGPHPLRPDIVWGHARGERPFIDGPVFRGARLSMSIFNNLLRMRVVDDAPAPEDQPWRVGVFEESPPISPEPLFARVEDDFPPLGENGEANLPALPCPVPQERPAPMPLMDEIFERPMHGPRGGRGYWRGGRGAGRGRGGWGFHNNRGGRGGGRGGHRGDRFEMDEERALERSRQRQLDRERQRELQEERERQREREFQEREARRGGRRYGYFFNNLR